MALRDLRARRSCHAVPGSNPRFLEKAQGLDADQVFLDIEDSVAPIAKADARKNIVEVLNTGDWGDKVRTVGRGGPEAAAAAIRRATDGASEATKGEDR